MFVSFNLYDIRVLQNSSLELLTGELGKYLGALELLTLLQNITHVHVKGIFLEVANNFGKKEELKAFHSKNMIEYIAIFRKIKFLLFQHNFL